MTVLALVVLSRTVGGMRSFDVFVDEVTYLRLAESVGQQGLPVLYGEPFYLHPPGGFLLQASAALVVGWPREVFEAVAQQRVVVALCAGVTAVALRLLGERLASPWVGRAAAAAVLLDPVMTRLTSRNLLEGPTGMWMVLGLLLLLRDGAAPGRLAAVGGGALLGLSVLTKDTALLVTAVPLAAAGLLRWLPRRRVLAALGALVAVYAVYPAWVAAQGQLGELLDQKLVGVARLSGQVQMTGFNAHEGVSFTDQVLDRAVQLGPSYVLLAAGGVAAVLLVLRSRRPEVRVVGLWAGSAVVLSAWTVLRGTLEEQLFYLLLVPGALAVPLAVHALAPRPGGWVRGPRTLLVLAASAWVVASFVTAVDVRTTRDDSFRQMTQHVSDCCTTDPPTTVAVLADPGDVLLQDVTVVTVGSVEELAGSGADLLLVSTRSLEDGTVPPDDVLRRAVADLPVVHEVAGPSVGRLLLLDLAGLRR